MADALRLADTEIEAALGDLPNWSISDDSIVATYTMATFLTGIELVRLAATSAEAANHHPDIDVRWRSVTFRLSTHDAGGITRRDLDLAHRIDGHARSLGWTLEAD